VITHTPVEHHDDPLREHWHYIPQAAAQVKIDKSKARADLGIDSFDYVVGVFGHVARNKRLESAIQAFRLLLDDHPNSLLIIAGPHDEPAYTEMLNNVASGLEDRISIPGAVNTVSWQTMLGACDVAIQLRDKSMGASSRAVNQVIAAGRPVIISDIPEWRYPETVAKRVPHGDLEIATLLQHLQTLADVDVQKAANQAALEYYRQNNSIEMMAARYRQIITQVASQAYIASHGVRPIRMSLDARLSEVIRESA
jgi:glycosyltransferase involved in cell wall biosynthesis